ncbi:MAG: restriction endonuclease subunit S, partial [Akkermansia sp.]
MIKHIETHGVIFWEKRIRIKDIAIFNKSSFSKKKCGRDIVSYLDTGNITANKIDKVIQYDLTKENLPSRAKRKVKKLDIVYSCVRPNKRHYGILKNPDENMLVSTGFSVISVNLNKANPFYIYYYIIQDHIINYLQAIAEGSVTAYPTIKSSDIASLVIKLPALEEQTKIAAILSSLDDKIELNHKINANLEAQAQAIFKSYFIDFEPFKNGEFIDSELGKIPKGWRVGKLSEIIQIKYGKDHKKLLTG